jgi:hypothetical protein
MHNVLIISIQANVKKVSFALDECNVKLILFADVGVVGNRLLQRFNINVNGSDEGGSIESGATGGSESDGRDIANLVIQHLDSVNAAQQHLLQLWHIKKIKLEQCFQLRLFEQDCEKMFEWICHNRENFLANYVEIGRSYQLGKCFFRLASLFFIR